MRHLVQGRHRPAHGEVVADGVGLDHRQHQRGGAHLEQVGDVAVVGVAEDDVQPPVAVRDGVRLVAGVDERALERGLEADLDLEEVAALGDLVARGARVDADADPPRAADDLAHHEERGEVPHDARERGGARHQVVLVGSVGDALAVGVVLVEVDSRRHRGQPGHGLAHDELAGAVPGDGRPRGGDLGRAVLGVGVVDVEAGAVGEHDVGQRGVLDVGELARVGGTPAHVEPAGVAQRRLVGVVPAGPRRPDAAGGGVGRDDVARGDHRVRRRVAGHDDAVLGLDPHHTAHGHVSTILTGCAATAEWLP